MSNTNGLVKVHVELPNHWATGGESMWAKPLGDDLYLVENIPFYIYGINLGDVVRAVSPDDETRAEVREVVEYRGHKTLRFFFSKNLDRTSQAKFLQVLIGAGASFERADERYIALDVPPESDYAHVCRLLGNAEHEGVLEYETCEIRVPGRFDEGPAGDA